SYYRLSQTDFDGHTQHYTASVVNNKTNGLFNIYPNPSKNGKVHLMGEDGAVLSDITVQDLTGKVIPAETFIRDNGVVDVEIDERYTSKGGIFIITASDGQKLIRHKLIIN